MLKATDQASNSTQYPTTTINEDPVGMSSNKKQANRINLKNTP